MRSIARSGNATLPLPANEKTRRSGSLVHQLPALAAAAGPRGGHRGRRAGAAAADVVQVILARARHAILRRRVLGRDVAARVIRAVNPFLVLGGLGVRVDA